MAQPLADLKNMKNPWIWFLPFAVWLMLGLTPQVAGGSSVSSSPLAQLPDGFELVVAAAAPLVSHPIMGCVDDRGRLFIGDAAGVNLKKADLEKQLPNRVLLLEDIDGDGIYDKSTIFADNMTFPQGACWLEGSLYVASPPGIWKLTDLDGDGVAEHREMIVGGFEYTGNAADVHGPFLHPNGRLYWCHGRKGHKVVQKDGTVVHEGLASGIWSCRPDGSDIQWHGLSSADNPTEIDFTPDGEIIGTVNLSFREPRGDTIIHWLYGGVYERSDQLKAIAGLPRTLKDMPVVHNFGHVAVSGCTFYRSGALNPAWTGDMFVTHFNTSKVVRLKLNREGATYTATESDFLKLNKPDSHVTDVMEDADGSLLVLDTGGWFRIGCPSSLMEKPDLKGAVYRVRKKHQPAPADPYGLAIRWDQASAEELSRLAHDPRWRVRQKAARLNFVPKSPAAVSALLATGKPHEQLQACELIAKSRRLDSHDRATLLRLLDGPLDPALEHATLYAGIATRGITLADLRQAKSPLLIRRLMVVVEQSEPDASVHDAVLALARQHADSPDTDLMRTAVEVAVRHPRVVELSQDVFSSWLAQKSVSKGRLNLLTTVIAAHLSEPPAQQLLTILLDHASPVVRQTAWRILAGQDGSIRNPDWIAILAQRLSQALDGLGSTARTAGDAPAVDADLTLLLDAVGKLRHDRFDAQLQSIVSDTRQPQAVRLKTLAALSRPGQALTPQGFELLMKICSEPTPSPARIEAARLLAASRLTKTQVQALIPFYAQTGPVELRELLKIVRRAPAELARAFAGSLAQSPVLSSLEESVIKTNFSSFPPEVYETILSPAIREAEAANEAKKRNLETLAASARHGRLTEGRKVFESGKGACIACHQIAGTGRSIGPNLSHIGQIRHERDLLESILFPNATLARDYETHVIETIDGERLMGIIRSQTEDVLRLVDLSGEEKAVPHGKIVASSALSTSLMPAGLENTMSEQELLDLVAWLVSLK